MMKTHEFITNNLLIVREMDRNGILRGNIIAKYEAYQLYRKYLLEDPKIFKKDAIEKVNIKLYAGRGNEGVIGRYIYDMKREWVGFSVSVV